MTNSKLNRLSTSELKQLKRDIQMLLEDRVNQSMSELIVGSTVTCNHPKTPGNWIVEKINKKTCRLSQDGRKVKAHLNYLDIV